MSSILGASVAVVILAAVHVAHAAEFEVHPSLAVSEEYTDNVFETTTNRVSDYITRVLPGIAMSYRAPALTGNLGYVFDYRYYARDTHKDETTHSLTAKGTLTAVENLLFLDASDEYQRVSLDATRDVTRESLFVNQSDRNVATVSPYLTLRVTERIPVKAGYRFIDTRYFDSVGIDKTDHIAFMETAYELSKRWSLTASYTFTRELADIDNFSQHQALGGFRYEYADKSFLFAQAGNAWTRYDSGQSLNSLNWNAGLTHVFDTVTGTVSTGVRYNEDPLSNVMKESFVSGSIVKRLKRGSMSFSPMYSEYVLTKTDTLQTKKYAATVSGQYEFTADLKGRVAFTAEKYEQPLLDSYTRRFQADSGLSYLLAEQLTAAFSYVYTGYSSPGIVYDNRHVNRAMVELKKTF
ncbi:MAG: TIGR03016 family PEP-CTERM system-associated outer membrane protein [Desulfuromonadaceae bacterium]|nr:TIGR03016 family PEP-CTERM system-associated outer membrane protein [Desulfuromonadaceae bacterium]